MSGLKDYDIMDIEAMDDERLEKSESGRIQVTRVYIKAEADKVIAELKESVKGLILDNYLKDKETRHNKYKRCLAMAMWCCDACDKWMMRKAKAIGLGKDGVKEYHKARRKLFHYMRWQTRWLKIAEKFKEA